MDIAGQGQPRARDLPGEPARDGGHNPMAGQALLDGPMQLGSEGFAELATHRILACLSR